MKLNLVYTGKGSNWLSQPYQFFLFLKECIDKVMDPSRVRDFVLVWLYEFLEVTNAIDHTEEDLEGSRPEEGAEESKKDRS